MRSNILTHNQIVELIKRLTIGGESVKIQDGPITQKIVDMILGNNEVAGSIRRTNDPKAYLEAIQSEVNDLYRKNLTDPKKRSLKAAKMFENLSYIERKRKLRALAFQENLDLSLLSPEAGREVFNAYEKTTIIKKNLLKKAGFPSVSLKSESAYKHYLNYSVDYFGEGYKAGEGIHPYLLNIGSSSFNANLNPSLMDDISISKSRIKNPDSLARLVERSKSFFLKGVGTGVEFPTNHLGIPIADIGKRKRVITWDTETTGLTPDSQVRDIAFSEHYITLNADKTFTSTTPKIILQESFASPLMDVAGVKRGGETMPLSVATYLREGGFKDEAEALLKDGDKFTKFKEAYSDGGAKGVNSFKNIIREFLKGDIVQGHNAQAFDIDKFMSTLLGLPAYQFDAEAKELVRQFQNKIENNPGYLVDTLDSARIFLGSQVHEIDKKLVPLLGTRPETATLIEELRSTILRTEEIMGGAKGTFSLENLFLNTNFIPLLEESGHSEELLKALTNQGTHTATIDTLFTAHLSTFLQNGELHWSREISKGMPPSGLSPESAALYLGNEDAIRKAMNETGLLRTSTEKSSFERFLRNRISRSSSITPVTNVRK